MQFPTGKVPGAEKWVQLEFVVFEDIEWLMGQIAGDNVTAEYREEITKKIIGLMFCNAIVGP